ncbi:syntaxin-12 [Eurytemora carolleeae]|uniref:syntaxin-12 n=1 Tax=Eurytemora carolleeae TaxID=1294199 RepID=UPI000C78AC27|nr:syntaxin-12 [Eurytemora carolleeae]|eukprot:XP_023341518.1 syntaxin-12-like [Eurytemora affinis]
MSEFERLSGVVATNIQKLVQNVSSMQRMIVHIDTQGDSLRQQLRQLQHYTGQLAKDTAQQLMNLGEVQGLDPREKMQKERLQDDFTRALNSFQRLQTESAQREKADLAVARQSGGDYHLPGPGETNTTQFRTQAMMQEEVDLNALQDRERAIRQLESDIVDVNTIFKDLATMVHEQGDIVDSIESNIESATVQVHQGTDQLSQAHTYANSARKKKIILATLGLVILAILIIIIAVEVKN